MKKCLLALVVVLLISAAVFWLVSVPKNYGGLRADNGVMDFSGADFDHTIHPLRGEWEFYWEKLYTPEDFAEGEPNEKTLADIPVSFAASMFSRRICRWAPAVIRSSGLTG
ncbi:MAG: hypothetical protein LBQ16_00400 [Gracilibacteraceae bacterium]|nr:hypothetical protein [Gracilibacteraceae bacterium]